MLDAELLAHAEHRLASGCSFGRHVAVALHDGLPPTDDSGSGSGVWTLPLLMPLP